MKTNGTDANYIACAFALMFLPNKSTMYKMLIANEVTYERAETIVKVIDEKVDALLDRIDGK